MGDQWERVEGGLTGGGRWSGDLIVRLAVGRRGGGGIVGLSGEGMRERDRGEEGIEK